MRITESQLIQIIKEEAASVKKELALKKELASIERQLNEVRAGGLHDAGETAGKKYQKSFDHPKNPVTGKANKDTIVEIEDEAFMDGDEDELKNALKVIAKACGLSGTIELEDEDQEGEMEPGDEMEADDDSEVNVDVEVEDEEGEEEEGEEEEGEEEEGEEEEQEEASAVAQEGMKEEGTKEEEVMKESFETKRMKQLAGIL